MQRPGMPEESHTVAAAPTQQEIHEPGNRPSPKATTPTCPDTVHRSCAAGAGKCPHAPDTLTPACATLAQFPPPTPLRSGG